MASEPESKIPKCGVCGGVHYRTLRTWTLQDGTIRRTRLCILCEEWCYESSEIPEKVPGAILDRIVRAVENPPQNPPETSTNANLGSSDLTQTEETHTVTAKAGGRAPPWKRTRPQTAKPNRKD